MIPNEDRLLADLEGAPTLWSGADIADRLAMNGANPVYPIIATVLRRFALNTWSKPPYKKELRSGVTNQQILEASLSGNFDGITEEDLFEAITDSLWANPTASIAAKRLAEISPAYAVLPRVVSPWAGRES